MKTWIGSLTSCSLFGILRDFGISDAHNVTQTISHSKSITFLAKQSETYFDQFHSLLTQPRTAAFVAPVAPQSPYPNSEATARTAPSASFPPTAATEIHTYRGSAPHAPTLYAGTLPERSHFLQTTVHTASPGAETFPAQTAGTASPKTASGTTSLKRTTALPLPAPRLPLLPIPHRGP